MTGSQSCLVAKLSYYIDLTDQDAKLLTMLEKTENAHERGKIYAGGERVDNLYVVKAGWLFGATIMPDNRRQIVKVYHSGDIVGFPDIAFEHATIDIFAAEDVVLCPFPKTALEEIFRQSPRLTALMFTLALRDQVILLDHVRALGRMSAVEKMCYFLLDLLARLRITNRHIGNTIRMPLTQTEIGDALGLTNVYVSKTLARMEADNLIKRASSTIRMVDEARMADICDFVDRYKDLDTSWLPQDEQH